MVMSVPTEIGPWPNSFLTSASLRPEGRENQKRGLSLAEPIFVSFDDRVYGNLHCSSRFTAKAKVIAAVRRIHQAAASQSPEGGLRGGLRESVFETMGHGPWFRKGEGYC